MLAHAAEGEDIAKLKERFNYLSQHGNVECSVQFEKLIGTKGPDGRLHGSCCAPMDDARYCQPSRNMLTSRRSRPTLTTFQRLWHRSS